MNNEQKWSSFPVERKFIDIIYYYSNIEIDGVLYFETKIFANGEESPRRITYDRADTLYG